MQKQIPEANSVLAGPLLKRVHYVHTTSCVASIVDAQIDVYKTTFSELAAVQCFLPTLYSCFLLMPFPTLVPI